MGSRSWVALVAFAAVGAACSKPNPAFVDSDPSITAGETIDETTTTGSTTTDETTTTSETTTTTGTTTEGDWAPECAYAPNFSPDYCPLFLNVAYLLPPVLKAACVGDTRFHIRRVMPKLVQVFAAEDPCEGTPSDEVMVDGAIDSDLVFPEGQCFEVFHEGVSVGMGCRTRAVVAFAAGAAPELDPPKIVAVVTSIALPKQLPDLSIQRSGAVTCDCAEVCEDPKIGPPSGWCCDGKVSQFGLELSSADDSRRFDLGQIQSGFQYRGKAYDLYMTRAHVGCEPMAVEDVSWTMFRP